MIWRIRDRTTFQRLRAEGRTVRAGGVSIRYFLDDGDDPPRLAFALPRTLGSAVVRNRLRRQARGIIASQAQAGELHAPSGAYLVRFSKREGGWTYALLDGELKRVFQKLGSRQPAPREQMAGK